jgi:hypothetical protein
MMPEGRGTAQGWWDCLACPRSWVPFPVPQKRKTNEARDIRGDTNDITNIWMILIMKN